MKKLPLAALLCVISSTIYGQELRIVNAASLSAVTVAPGSIISIFGTKLTTGVASAADVQHPPASLGGVTVTIAGAPAALFYVSPTQINAVVNAATPAGRDTVTIASAVGTQTGSVTVGADAPPGLFSLSGSGTRDGAILNAITFLLGDFSTRTANSPTYLALFATGLTSNTPAVTIGGVPVTVTFAGPTPCCAGLQQINVMLPDSLAGAGRVPVVVTVNGHASNTVEIVLLPPSTARQFNDDQDNHSRSRELAALAYIPGTSLVLSTDQNDDVVRVIDVNAKSVTRVIALPDGAAPTGIAVNATGATAVVAETGRGKMAILNLTSFAVTNETNVGAAPSRVAIAGTQAVVVNRDDDTVTIVDLTTGAAQKTLAVGRGPMGLAVDAAARKAYVANENDGTISVIDLNALAAAAPISLGASVRPQGIALVPSAGVAFVTAPGNGPDGTVLLVNLNTKAITTLQANPDHSGGSSDAVYFNGKVYFANQTGGSISILPISPSTGAPTGAITTVKVDLGARALAIDTKDNLLVVSNEGTGTLVLVNLNSNAVTGRIDAVRSDGNDDQDDRSDRDRASNLPAVQTLSPASGKAGTTFTLTITGSNLGGATEISFGGNEGNGKGNDRSSDFTVKNIAVSANGTQLTASVSIAASAKPGGRIVQVTTPNGDSDAKHAGAAVFMVLP